MDEQKEYSCYVEYRDANDKVLERSEVFTAPERAQAEAMAVNSRRNRLKSPFPNMFQTEIRLGEPEPVPTPAPTPVGGKDTAPKA